MALASSASRLCLSLIMVAKDALQASSQTCSWSLPSSFPDNTCTDMRYMKIKRSRHRCHSMSDAQGPYLCFSCKKAQSFYVQSMLIGLANACLL